MSTTTRTPLTYAQQLASAHAQWPGQYTDEELADHVRSEMVNAPFGRAAAHAAITADLALEEKLLAVDAAAHGPFCPWIDGGAV